MKVGIVRERTPGERRVAATPQSVKGLVHNGFEVICQAGAGAAANLSDAAYAEAGARVVADAATVWAEAEIVLKVHAPLLGGHDDEVAGVRRDQLVIALLDPARNGELLQALAERGASALALDRIPRISRAQKMDVLSSMANIAGYRAVIEAAHAYGRTFAGQITAAGQTPPARVLVIGGGVAGLAAIAAARSLGAEVRAFDVRPAVAEQVESLGARFLLLDLPMDEGEGAGGYANMQSDAFLAAEQALFAQQAAEVDVIITTALIPGRPAPLLVTDEALAAMAPGSVVVDLAAAQGGNVAGTVAGQVVQRGGVTVLGFTDLTSRMPAHASEFFGNNVAHLLDALGGAGGFALDLDDEVVYDSLVVHQGAVRWPIPRRVPQREPQSTPAVRAKPAELAAEPPGPQRPRRTGIGTNLLRAGLGLGAAVGLTLVGLYAPTEFVQHLTVFVLACFVGWQVIWNVAPALHTPLMAVTNAISGIIVVGGILVAGAGTLDVPVVLGAVAILVASVNIVGGFWVSERMLRMFRKEVS